MTDIKNLVQDVISTPLGSIISSVGEGVAAAQNALDEGSIGAVLDIYSEGGDEKLALLREIGYRPTFYTLPETTGEVKVALRLGQTAGVKSVSKPAANRVQNPAIATHLGRQGINIGTVKKMYATPVDAGYANRYGFSADIGATLTFKIVPVPAPEGADELRLTPDLIGKMAIEAEITLQQFGLVTVFEDALSGTEISDPDNTMIVNGQIPTPEQQKISRAGDQITLKLSIAT